MTLLRYDSDCGSNNDLLIYRQAIALHTTCRTLNFVLTPIWVRKKQARILSLVELTHLRGGPDHNRYLRLIDPNKHSQYAVNIFECTKRKESKDKYNFEKESTNSREAFFGEQLELTRIE